MHACMHVCMYVYTHDFLPLGRLPEAALSPAFARRFLRRAAEASELPESFGNVGSSNKFGGPLQGFRDRDV